MRSYLEFAVASNFSFLRGASHPEELMLQAARIGLAGIGLCDRNSVAGVVRAHLIKREKGLTLAYHPGARLVFADNTPDILVYPRDRPAWGRLCRLLTRGNLRAKKGKCLLHVSDLLEHVDGLELIVMDGSTADAEQTLHLLQVLREAAAGRVRLAATMLYRGNDRARLARRAQLAREARMALIAVNDVFYHHPDRRELQDIVTCIREGTTIDAAGWRLAANAERYLKPAREMARLFRDHLQAVDETLALHDALTFSLDELKYEYPDEKRPGFASAQDELVHLARDGAAARYPQGIPENVRCTLDHELALIAKLEYAPYFLTVHHIVRYARALNILCQGRGSAANSAVCYCLGITDVDPRDGRLLFERFISSERGEPPDIDVDFEHERREEVIQHIYQHYGRDHTGIAATVISYRGRSAIREVGKAFGLSEDVIGALSSSIWGMGGAVREAELASAGIDLSSARVQKMRALAIAIQSFPRHLSQHVGGFVITRSPLDEVVPIGNGAMKDRTFVEWDKDDLDALGILKVDVLGLGMLTCVRKAFELAERHYGLSFRAGRPDNEKKRFFSLSTIPKEDEAVYRMLQRADSVGVFQVESRAQMSMLPRLQPREFYDLVIEVAIVRPGPIQGDMVHPYLRRRQGLEPVTYPSPDLEAVLGKTLGVPLFQEQAMRIAIVAGGFTPGEADRLRRAMATFKRTGTIATFRRKMIDGMVARNYPREFAERCFSQIEGFGEYGFPESHAASFALLVYASAWLKCRYPDVFAAALLNSQPMGFYASAQIVRDVREHGVEVRPIDINHSDWDATLEPGPLPAQRMHALHGDMAADMRSTHAVRLGFRQIKGLSEEDARRIVQARSVPGAAQHAVMSRGPGTVTGSGDPGSAVHRFELHRMRDTSELLPYRSARDLWLRTGLSPRVVERLADADAFGSLGLSRRQALWAAKALGRVGDQHDDLPLLRGAGLPERPGEEKPPAVHQRETDAAIPPEPAVSLPPMGFGEEVVQDYRALELSLRAHPASFLRTDLARRNIIANAELRARRSGERVAVSGLVTIRQRPGSANGVIFMTIEDEMAIANIIVWPKTFERFRPIVLGARYIAVHGELQEQSGVIHVVAAKLEDLTFLLARLTESGPQIESLARADAVKRPHDEAIDSRARGRRNPPRLTAPAQLPNLLASDLDVPARGSAHTPARKSASFHNQRPEEV